MFVANVIKGDGVGRKLGYPTANLDISVKKIGLKAGVYVAYAFLNKKKYRAALAIQEKLNKVEVHLLDYAGPDFYGQILSVCPGGKISEMQGFANQEGLKKKIAEDIEEIKKVLNSKL